MIIQGACIEVESDIFLRSSSKYLVMAEVDSQLL